MYGKMQESGLPEIIPLIYTSVIWGQYPVFSHPEFPQAAPSREAAVWWQAFIVSFLSPLGAHCGADSNVVARSFIYWYGRQYFSPQGHSVLWEKLAEQVFR